MKFSPGPASLWETAVFDPLSAAISGGVSLIGGLMSSGAASDAAGAQTAAAARSADMAMEQYRTTRNDLAPFRGYGTTAGDNLVSRLQELTAPFNPTQATLEATPGYQFIRDQGLKGVQNSAAAKGLGISGAALKGAADYSTGLAQNTYKNLYDIDQGNKTNAFNKLLGTTNLGASAAAQSGALGNAAVGNATNAISSGANAAASGIVGSNNAVVGGLNNAAGMFQTYQMMNRLAPSQPAATYDGAVAPLLASYRAGGY